MVTSTSRPRSNEALLADLTPRLARYRRAMNEALSELAPETCPGCASAARILGEVDLPEHGLIDRHQASRILGVSAERVDQHAREGRLPFVLNDAGRRAYRTIDVLALRRRG